MNIILEPYLTLSLSLSERQYVDMFGILFRLIWSQRIWTNISFCIQSRYLPNGLIGQLAAWPVVMACKIEPVAVKVAVLASSPPLSPLIWRRHKRVMRVDHVGPLASIIEQIIIVPEIWFSKQPLIPHRMDHLLLNMKQLGDMAFVRVCVLACQAAFHSIGF